MNKETELISKLKSKDYEIRNDAIEALGEYKTEEAENALIEFIVTSKDPFDIVTANVSLGKCGTQGCIPYLIKLLLHPNQDVRCSAIHSLGILGNSTLTPVFINALNHRCPVTKAYAVSAIKKHGDETAILPISDYIKKYVSKKRKIQADPSPLIEALKFLINFVNSNEEVKKTFSYVIKKENNVFRNEKHWIQNHIQKGN
ncbi:HEAT repeat domain-containing protein [Neobacillus citreus]|uniref:HEAT repeat domain-containing protein n=1 Tax=Neobacillus citreus TaxID=2833578 RepID=A0A942T331_9BACI|nr:HEAT repeat domain-containing protein [Neobacillus citreus]MCH6266575.1 HEAT repeat domain-containing protein [Neobacillus citreus]